MNRLFLALGAYVVIAVLAWATIRDQKIRLATLAVLAMFAIKTLLHRKEAVGPKVKSGESEHTPV